MSTDGGRIIEVYDTGDALAHRAADLFVQRFEGHHPGSPFRVALSGGSTPRKFHSLLAQPGYRERVDWSRIEFYWGDERCVPPDDAESNYRMARETLLDHVPVSISQIHRMRGELTDVADAAVLYEGELRAGFALTGDEIPRFDLIFLGMGPDGHTASLFPHTQALHVMDRLAVANYVPKLNANRLTLTVPVLNNAACIAFVVAGEDKAESLKQVLEGAGHPDEYPSQLIAPVHGQVYWLCDHAAARLLRHE